MKSVIWIIISIFLFSFSAHPGPDASKLPKQLIKVGGNTKSGFEKMSCRDIEKVVMTSMFQSGSEYLQSQEINLESCNTSGAAGMVKAIFTSAADKCKEAKFRLWDQLEADKKNFADILEIKIALYDTQYVFPTTEGRKLFSNRECTPNLVNNAFAKLRAGNRGDKTDAQLVMTPAFFYCQITETVGSSESPADRMARLYGPEGKKAAEDRMYCQTMLDNIRPPDEAFASGFKSRPAAEQKVSQRRDCDTSRVSCSEFMKSAIMGGGASRCFNDTYVYCQTNPGGSSGSDTRYAEEARPTGGSVAVPVGSSSPTGFNFFNGGNRNSAPGKK